MTPLTAARSAPVRPLPGLKEHLDGLYRRFDRRFLSPDPLEFLHRYDDPADIELFGFYAAGVAYGRVDQIRRTLEELARRLGPRPARRVRQFDARHDSALFKDFVHRFHGPRDFALLTELLRRALEESGSLGAAFARGHAAEAADIGPALTDFCRRLTAPVDLPLTRSGRLPPRSPVRFFFSAPDDGSACKRLNLYLRWMVRHDAHGLDFGLWPQVSPAQLVIPLDTHVARLATNLGLTRRKSVDWKMALEVTDALRRFDSADPVRYDFALCRLGILALCPRRRDAVKCAACALQPVCTL